MKKAYTTLGILCWCLLGGFIGRTLHIIKEHNDQGEKMRELAEQMGLADDWIKNIVVSGAVIAGIILVCIIARIVIKKKYTDSFETDKKE